MEYKFLDIDISAATFQGLSQPYQRFIAGMANLILSAVFLYIGYVYGVQCLGEIKADNEIVILLVAVTVLYYMVRKKFIFLSAAQAMVKLTPLEALKRQDMSVLDKAKEELLRVVGRVKLKDYFDYGKMNPAIFSPESLRVMAHQARGDLLDWIGNHDHLKQLADLVYQLHLVEQIFAEDRVPCAECPLLRQPKP